MYRNALIDNSQDQDTHAVIERIAHENAAPVRLAQHLALVREWLSVDMNRLEETLDTVLQAPSNGAEQAGRHLLATRGKRLRALGALLCSRMGEDSNDRDALDVAAAVELVHCATLLHDDVIDEASVRRNGATANVVYGNSVSILGGDHVLVTALQRVQRIGCARTMSEMLETLQRLVTAEAIQLDLRGTFQPSRETYLQIAEGKTASLFSWAFAAGARCGQLPDAGVELLREIGFQLGVAFQIIDDVIDLESGTSVAGKDMQNDLREGKFTWPLILAAERAPDLVHDLRTLSERFDQELADRIVQTVRKLGALADARHFAVAQTDTAVEQLFTFAPCTARDHLIGLIRAATARQF